MVDEREATVRRIYKLLEKVRDLKMIARRKKNEHIFKFSWIESQLRSELQELASPLVHDLSPYKLFEKLDKVKKAETRKKSRAQILPFARNHRH